jgi:hypothetical protein
MHTVISIKMEVPALTGTVGGKGCPTHELVYCTRNIRAPVQSSGKGKLWQDNKKLLTASKSSVLHFLNTSSPCHHINNPTSQISMYTANSRNSYRFNELIIYSFLKERRGTVSQLQELTFKYVAIT